MQVGHTVVAQDPRPRSGRNPERGRRYVRTVKALSACVEDLVFGFGWVLVGSE
jgi:hypothetical protein